MRCAPLLPALLLFTAGCPSEPRSVPATDAGADATVGADAATDAAAPVCGPDDGVFATHDHCRGCGQPCDDAHPFCCAGTCCAEECGSAVNVCSPGPDPLRPDSAGDGDDQCAELGWSHDNCFDCGVGCGSARPFCCGGTCCVDECAQEPNDCSDAH